MDLHIHIAHLHLNLPSGSPVSDLLTQIKTQGETIIMKLDGVNQELAGLKQDVADETAQAARDFAAVNANVAGLSAQVEDLKAQLAAGTGVSQADLDAVQAQIAEVRASVKKIDPTEDVPAPVDPPADPPVDPPAVP